MANAINLAQKSFLLVSGASRGIGRALAVECAAQMAAGSLIVLLARSSSGLEETKAMILEQNSQNITVIIHTIDLTRPSPAELSAIFSTALEGRTANEFDLVMIVHNIGTIGPVSKFAREIGAEASLWQDYFAINVFSVAALNSAFLDAMKSKVNSTQRVFIVNVTSGTAIAPFSSLTLYW